MSMLIGTKSMATGSKHSRSRLKYSDGISLLRLTRDSNAGDTRILLLPLMKLRSIQLIPITIQNRILSIIRISLAHKFLKTRNRTTSHHKDSSHQRILEFSRVTARRMHRIISRGPRPSSLHKTKQLLLQWAINSKISTQNRKL